MQDATVLNQTRTVSKFESKPEEQRAAVPTMTTAGWFPQVHPKNHLICSLGSHFQVCYFFTFLLITFLLFILAHW